MTARESATSSYNLPAVIGRDGVDWATWMTFVKDEEPELTEGRRASEALIEELEYLRNLVHETRSFRGHRS